METTVARSGILTNKIQENMKSCFGFQNCAHYSPASHVLHFSDVQYIIYDLFIFLIYNRWVVYELDLCLHFFNDHRMYINVHINWSKAEKNTQTTNAWSFTMPNTCIVFFQVMCFTWDDATLPGARWLGVSWMNPDPSKGGLFWGPQNTPAEYRVSFPFHWKVQRFLTHFINLHERYVGSI